MDGLSGENVRLVSRLRISPLHRTLYVKGTHGGDAALTHGRNVMRFSLTRWLPAVVVGAILLTAAPAPAQVFVPPRNAGTSVQSNWNYWVNGGYPNPTNAALYRYTLATGLYGNLYNPI